MDKQIISKIQRFVTPMRLRIFILSLVLMLAGFVLYLDITVRAQFEGKRWALPAKVYARPLELYSGMKLRPEQLFMELSLLGYRSAGSQLEPGSFRQVDAGFAMMTRPFTFWDGAQGALELRVEFDENRLRTLDNLTGPEHSAIPVRLDPQYIGGIYPAHNEDRVLVRLSDVPLLLIKGLITIEDKKFYTHHGIDPRGIGRAILSILQGDGVQGGSTITQQLVKNFFLTPDRTLRRKFTEILMAQLLELHYSKEEILEAYLNEIYLGQDGNRAIHGIGLASLFYFSRPISQIGINEAALLVALIKGPSYYDPRRNPARALSRRNLVLQEMVQKQIITQQEFINARSAPLGVVDHVPVGTSLYPAFVELVHRQLRRDYREADLRTEGLLIFTTLDPQVQFTAERSLVSRLGQLEQSRKITPNTLDGAVVVTHSQNGEVQALVGGRNTRYEGFNRALDAQRPIGSLLKPVIFLSALEQPHAYTLATILDDSPLIWRERGAPDWEPRNYDKIFHGKVPLYSALANSYNVSAARLGLSLGVSKVMDNVQRLGIDRNLNTFASSLLGAVDLSPIEVAQLYQTLASNGFRVPLRSIREVLTADGQPLQRFSLSLQQVIDPGPAFLTTTALQYVVHEGTAEGLSRYLQPDLQIAGKTGTTNDLRDSWFAGYTGDRLAVVWIGRDDNQPINMTGSSGAMTIWGDMMSKLDPEPLRPLQPENIELAWADPANGLKADETCHNARLLPFIRGSVPTETSQCISRAPSESVKSWFKRLFQ